MRDRVLGHYYRVSGPTMGRYLLADDFEELDDQPAHDELLIRARSV